MSRLLQINNTRITDSSPAYVIAEIGHNHQGNLETCISLFKKASDCGVSAVKLQKRNNKNLFAANFYNSAYNSENSFGSTYGEHREFLEFGKEEYEELIKVAKKLDIDFFATAFDESSADFLMELQMPAIKIASGDLRSIQLLKYCAKFKVPLIVSTGASELSDVIRAVDILKNSDAKFSILQCTAEYPCTYEHLNLNVIKTYRELFEDLIIGISSHDSGISLAGPAYVLGARIIEKHFTLDRTMKGTDHAFSLEPVGMKKLVRDLDRLYLALGNGEKVIYENELAPLQKMSKKIVASKDLYAGQVIKESDVIMKTSSTGLWPYQLELILGKKLLSNVSKDEAILFKHLNQ